MFDTEIRVQGYFDWEILGLLKQFSGFEKCLSWNAVTSEAGVSDGGRYDFRSNFRKAEGILAPWLGPAGLTWGMEFGDVLALKQI